MKTFFVDCFNTIVKRNVSSNKLIKNWAYEMSSFFNYSIDEEKLISLRKAAVKMDKISWEHHFGLGEYSAKTMYEILLKNIEVFKLTTLTANQKNAFVGKSIEVELENEKKHSYINKKVLNFITKQKRAGNKIYLLSDYYHSKNYIIELLTHLGVIGLFDDIFISNQYKKSKYSGSFYSYVLTKLNLPAKDCVMIGDNVISDIKNAKKAGLKTIHIHSNEKELNKKLEKTSNKDLWKNLNVIFKKDVTYSAYVNYAFPLYEFTKKLYKNCVCKNIDKLYFFAREGQFLKTLFDEFQKDQIAKIKTYYLEVSRNSLLVPSLSTDLETETFEKMLNKIKHISVIDFLKTLSLNEKEINIILQSVNIESDHQYIVQDFKKDPLLILKKSQEFKKIYVDKVKDQRKLLTDYFAQFDITEKINKIAIVDVGWAGTMQDYLRDVISPNVEIEGYYLGLMNVGGFSNNNKKFGLLFSDAPFDRSETGQVYSVNNFNYEFILQANKNKTNSYKLAKDKVVPSYEASDDVEIYNKYVKELQNKILGKFIKIKNFVIKNKITDFENYVLYFNYKMIMKQKIKDYKFILMLRKLHYEGFGNYGKIYKDLKFNFYQLMAFLYKKYKMFEFYKNLTNKNIN